MILPMTYLNSALIVDIDFLGSEEWLWLQDEFGDVGARTKNEGRVEWGRLAIFFYGDLLF